MAVGNKQNLQGGRELINIAQKDTYAGSLFLRIINAINQLGSNTATSPLGKLSAPEPPNDIQVQGTLDTSSNTITCPSEHLHWTVTHNAAIQKGIQYLTEIDTDQNFTAPHVVDHGCSRSGFLHLPSFQNDGTTPQTYYMRSYAQYHGSDPSQKTVFGGVNGATKIAMTGTSGTTLLSSQGSGTAANGQQGGKGLGVVLNRPAPGPKRNLKP